jgi:hypothetical protein
MSFEEQIIATYGPIFNMRLYWDQSPQGWVAANMEEPFGILQAVGGRRQEYVDDKEQPEYLNARVQLSVWGRHRIAVSNKMREMQAAVMASNTPEFYATVIGEPVGDSNETLSLRGSRQDFSFWYKNPLFVG